MDLVNSQTVDLKRIAQCHIAAFPGSLSSKLGLGYCMKMMSWYLADERGILFHIENESNLLGYCGGIKMVNEGMHGSATSITQYTFISILISFLIRPWLIFHPDIRNRVPFVWKNLKLKIGLSKASYPNTNKEQKKIFVPSLGLVVIGVNPHYQGKGYGTLLLREFEKRAREMGFMKIHLSVKKDNSQAIHSYLKSGWLVDKVGNEEQSMFKLLD